MIILGFTEQWGQMGAGSAMHVRELCAALARIGHHVLIGVPGKVQVGDERRIMGAGSLECRGLGEGLRDNYISRWSRWRLLHKARISLPMWIAEIGPDVVHVFYGHTLALVLGSVPPKLPTVWTVHNVPPQEYGPLETLLPNWMNSVLTKAYFSAAGVLHGARLSRSVADKIIASSEATKRRIVNRGLSSGKVTVIPCGIDSVKFQQPLKTRRQSSDHEGSPVLLSVGKVAPHKGQIDLLQILNRLRIRYPGIRYINVGKVTSRSYFDLLQHEVSRLGLNGLCEFRTNVDSTELVSLYQSCDVYVQPSREEGFCMAVLEAIAAGCKVVGTEVGEIPLMVNGSKAGVVVPPGDLTALGDGISRLLDGRENNLASSEERYDFVWRRYRWEAVAQMTVNLYETISKEKEHGGTGTYG